MAPMIIVLATSTMATLEDIPTMKTSLSIHSKNGENTNRNLIRYLFRHSVTVKCTLETDTFSISLRLARCTAVSSI
jgi:hypothetical protein